MPAGNEPASARPGCTRLAVPPRNRTGLPHPLPVSHALRLLARGTGDVRTSGTLLPGVVPRSHRSASIGQESHNRPAVEQVNHARPRNHVAALSRQSHHFRQVSPSVTLGSTRAGLREIGAQTPAHPAYHGLADEEQPRPHGHALAHDFSPRCMIHAKQTNMAQTAHIARASGQDRPSANSIIFPSTTEPVAATMTA